MARKHKETAAGFTDLPFTRLLVRCDYCDRLCRRTGISGHKQKCGGWAAQYAPAERPCPDCGYPIFADSSVHICMKP